MKTLTNSLCLLLIAVLAITLNSCEKEKANLISVTVLEKTFNFEDEYQIEATSKSAISYTVENEYHATITQSGYLTAGRVGETTISLNNSEDQKTFKVTVKPKYNLYPEPNVKFGDTKSSIIAQFGSDYIETEGNVGYTNYSNTAPIIMFTFDASNKLKSYAIMVESSYTSILGSFLAERYLPVKEEDGIFLFANGLNSKTTTLAIALQLYNTSYWMAMYMPFTSTTKSPHNKYITIPKEFDNLLKKLINN